MKLRNIRMPGKRVDGQRAWGTKEARDAAIAVAGQTLELPAGKWDAEDVAAAVEFAAGLFAKIGDSLPTEHRTRDRVENMRDRCLALRDRLSTPAEIESERAERNRVLKKQLEDRGEKNVPDDIADRLNLGG